MVSQLLQPDPPVYNMSAGIHNTHSIHQRQATRSAQDTTHLTMTSTTQGRFPWWPAKFLEYAPVEGVVVPKLKCFYFLPPEFCFLPTESSSLPPECCSLPQEALRQVEFLDEAPTSSPVELSCFIKALTHAHTHTYTHIHTHNTHTHTHTYTHNTHTHTHIHTHTHTKTHTCVRAHTHTHTHTYTHTHTHTHIHTYTHAHTHTHIHTHTHTRTSFARRRITRACPAACRSCSSL
jgi:hypothetical protein